ncbi:MAG: membrane dipeptidase [Pseudomonadota bacterium]
MMKPHIQSQVSRRTFLAGSTTTAASLGLVACGRGGPSPVEAGYVDGLSFLPEDFDLITESGLSAMICDVSKVEEVVDAFGVVRYQRNFAPNDAALDDAIAKIESNPQVFLARRGTDIKNQPGCAAFLQFQSCETIGEDLSRIAYFHQKGLRILQLTHHNNNLFAGGAIERIHTGLTDHGREGLAEMNRVGILPDVSHGSPQTISETAQASRSPVIYSHGACRALLDHPRCITDEGIRAIADNGGVVGIFMMSFWLTKESEPNVDHLIAHLQHVIEVGGIDAVGIANDFPMSGQQNLVRLNNDNREGVKQYLGWWRAMREVGVAGFEEDPEHVVIPELNNISRMELIDLALAQKGYGSSDRAKIMGGNWARVLIDTLR